MSDAGAFELLHPVIQHHVVNTLGWQGLRPLQAAAVAPLMSGSDSLLLAPTAGGKTEAALLPVLSAMEQQAWSGLSVLYVCPLKALLNNLEPRVACLRGMAGSDGIDPSRGHRRWGQVAADARAPRHPADHPRVVGGHARLHLGRRTSDVRRRPRRDRRRGSRVRRRRPRVAPACRP